MVFSEEGYCHRQRVHPHSMALGKRNLLQSAQTKQIEAVFKAQMKSFWCINNEQHCPASRWFEDPFRRKGGVVDGEK